MKLVEPNIKYKASHLEALKEIMKDDNRYFELYNQASNNFERYVEYIKRLATHPDEGEVPSTHLWLVEGDLFLGRLSVRPSLDDFMLKFGGHIGYIIAPAYRKHGYGYRILQLGLAYVCSIGMKRVLLTCNEDNIGSKKIIESCGGKLENKLYDERINKNKLRYWIELEE